MNKITYIFHCPSCGADTETVEPLPVRECPHCRSPWGRTYAELTCDCGEAVLLTGFTNTCPKCGAMYNHAGQRLAPVEEWDPEDRYACFGPQNSEDD